MELSRAFQNAVKTLGDTYGLDEHQQNEMVGKVQLWLLKFANRKPQPLELWRDTLKINLSFFVDDYLSKLEEERAELFKKQIMQCIDNELEIKK